MGKNEVFIKDGEECLYKGFRVKLLGVPPSLGTKDDIGTNIYPSQEDYRAIIFYLEGPRMGQEDNVAMVDLQKIIGG